MLIIIHNNQEKPHFTTDLHNDYYHNYHRELGEKVLTETLNSTFEPKFEYAVMNDERNSKLDDNVGDAGNRVNLISWSTCSSSAFLSCRIYLLLVHLLK